MRKSTDANLNSLSDFKFAQMKQKGKTTQAKCCSTIKSLSLKNNEFESYSRVPRSADSHILHLQKSLVGFTINASSVSYLEKIACCSLTFSLLMHMTRKCLESPSVTR